LLSINHPDADFESDAAVKRSILIKDVRRRRQEKLVMIVLEIYDPKTRNRFASTRTRQKEHILDDFSRSIKPSSCARVITG
jgi:hypothetical protein